ncbi:MAG: nucleotidyltransferase domain-containing protein [Spirochaetia bacterium]
MIEIDVTQQQELGKIRGNYRIRLILAFGSRVKGFVHRNSDLDIGVLYGGEQKPLDVAVDLQKVLHGYQLDIVNLNRADPLLLNEVNKGCQLLSGDESDLQNFRIYAFHRYQDFKPYLELEAQLNARRLESLKDVH